MKEIKPCVHKMIPRFKKLIQCMLFLGIAIFLFTKVTYLFRNASVARKNVTGIEAEDDLDVVYIGSSSAYVYWQPLRAWNDCGFTSYLYAHDSMVAEAVRYYMEEVLTTHNPDLFIVDIRSFMVWSEDFEESALRNGTDSMSLFSPSRWKLVTKFLSNHELTEDTDVLSFYLDITKYHSSDESLSSSSNWGFINNTGKNDYKGWVFNYLYTYLEEPEIFSTPVKADLEEGCKDTLYDLLDYCTEQDLEVLFVLGPYYFTESMQETYNSLEEIISSYNFPCLNANEYYDEMELDFHTDFYNRTHVNCYGAEKYTCFLEQYLLEHYDLKDHRAEEGYEDWDKLYQDFLAEEEHCKEEIDKKIEDRAEAFAVSDEISSVTDVDIWSMYAQNDYFIKLVVWTGEEIENSVLTDTILDNLGITINSGEVQIVAATSSIQSLEQTSSSCSAVLAIEGVYEAATVELSSNESEASIQINGEEFCLNGEGIHIVLYDNNVNTVVDSVVLSCDENGELSLER